MSERFAVGDTPLAGLKVLTRRIIGDERGFLERLFCADELEEVFGDRKIQQINRTLTEKQGTVRGMHFQYPPHAELKIVSCLRGEVFDVAVDLRVGSPTFLQWHGEVLTGKNHRTLFIPEGFAHGFQTLTDTCELIYFHSDRYVPDAEGALNAEDPRIGIEWPHPLGERSQRDQGHPFIDESFRGLTV